MDQSRVLLIGFFSPTGAWRSGNFFTDTNLNEIHTIIWTPETFLEDLESRFGIDLAEPLDWSYGTDLSKIIGQRLKTILDWVQRGNSLVIHTCRPPTFLYWDIDQREKNEFSLSGVAPFSWARWRPVRGRMINFCGPGPARELCQAVLSAPQYEVVLKSSVLLPLLWVSAARASEPQLVAGWRRFGAGTVVFIPLPNWDESMWMDPICVAPYLEAMAELPARLGDGDIELPPWADAFRLPDEAAARTEIARLEAKVAQLEQKVRAQRAIVQAAQPAKRLFASTGEDFASAVKEALEELGLKVVHGPKPRADLLAWNGARLAAIEAKGLNGAARESNLRQAERWRADVVATLSASPGESRKDPDLLQYAERLCDLGVPLEGPEKPADCHGIMVIGTFRQKSLLERTEPDFPDPVVRVITRAPVCALTGLQLLGLVLEAQSNPKQRKKVVDALFTTKGVLAEATDWRAFLETASAEAEPDSPATKS